MRSMNDTTIERRTESQPRPVIHFSQGVDNSVETPHVTVDGSGKVVIHRWTTLIPPRARHTPPTAVVDNYRRNDLRRRSSSTSSTEPMDTTKLHMESRSTAQLGTARSVDRAQH